MKNKTPQGKTNNTIKEPLENNMLTMCKDLISFDENEKYSQALNAFFMGENKNAKEQREGLICGTVLDSIVVIFDIRSPDYQINNTDLDRHHMYQEIINVNNKSENLSRKIITFFIAGTEANDILYISKKNQHLELGSAFVKTDKKIEKTSI